MGYLIVVSVAAAVLILYIDFNARYSLRTQKELTDKYKELLESREETIVNLMNMVKHNHVMVPTSSKIEFETAPSHMTDEEMAMAEEIKRLQNEPA
jgi:hypothetical protein